MFNYVSIVLSAYLCDYWTESWKYIFLTLENMMCWKLLAGVIVC
jgi:hypothetical protein